MVQQTTECAWFIRDYKKIEEFCKLHTKIYYYLLLRTHSCEERRKGKNVASSGKDSLSRNLMNCELLSKAEGIVEIEIAAILPWASLMGGLEIEGN